MMGQVMFFSFFELHGASYGRKLIFPNMNVMNIDKRMIKESINCVLIATELHISYKFKDPNGANLG